MAIRSIHSPRNRNACLDKTINFLQQQTFQTFCNSRSNLIKAKWKDLLALKNNSKLIIKAADKGGCVVLMNKSHYKKMIFQHLNDADTYQKTDQKCDNGVMKREMNWQRNMSHSLQKRGKLYLTNISFSKVIFIDYRRLINLNKYMMLFNNKIMNT